MKNTYVLCKDWSVEDKMLYVKKCIGDDIPHGKLCGYGACSRSEILNLYEGSNVLYCYSDGMMSYDDEVSPSRLSDFKQITLEELKSEAMQKITKSCGRKFAVGIGYEKLPELVEPLLNPSKPELTKDDSPQGVLSRISNRLHNMGCEYQDSELGDELGSMACEVWGVLPLVSNESIEAKPKRTKVSYEKVTESIFDLKEEFERGDLYEKGMGYYTMLASESDFAFAYRESAIYRRIETEVSEREEFIEIACNELEEAHGERRQYLIESLFDSGKFKLVG